MVQPKQKGANVFLTGRAGNNAMVALLTLMFLQTSRSTYEPQASAVSEGAKGEFFYDRVHLERTTVL